MSRKHFIPVTTIPYHVVAHSNNHDWFSLPISEVWKIFEDYLYFITFAYGVRIHSFVLMQNHFHMMLTTPEGNLPQAMNYLLRETSKVIGRNCGRQNHIYGGPYWWSIISKEIYYAHCLKYVYRNPVSAKVTVNVEDYPYSTISGLYGLRKIHIPIYKSIADSMLPLCDEALFKWLNQKYSEEIRLKIQDATRHKYFAFPKDRISRKPDELEFTLF